MLIHNKIIKKIEKVEDTIINVKNELKTLKNRVRAYKGWTNLGVVILHRTMPGLVVAEGVSSQVQQEIYDAVAQETKELEDEINFVSVYPVATLGLSYQF